jgi:hypothetical protein
MSKLEAALATAQSQMPECVASGYVDMSTGMLPGPAVDSHLAGARSRRGRDG